MLTDDEKRKLIAELRMRHERTKKRLPDPSQPTLSSRAADALEETLRGEWQYSYVEKSVDGSGVFERVTFQTREQAAMYLANNAVSVNGFNGEVEADERIAASIERRKVVTPSEWEVVPDGNH